MKHIPNFFWKQIVLCTTVWWTCGHVTTHPPQRPQKYCPVCCGQTFLRITDQTKAAA